MWEGGRPVYYIAFLRFAYQLFWGYPEEQSTWPMAFDSSHLLRVTASMTASPSLYLQFSMSLLILLSMTLWLGAGGKFDVVSAYRNVAIHPQDRSLLGMKWRDKYYVDMAPPFGLCSAPYIFTFIADMVEWILTHNYGVDFLNHYWDDFMTLGPPASPVCHYNLQACIRLCSIFCLPLHPPKLENPTTRLSILGIELDSTTLQARLLVEKRDRIISLLDTWSAKRFCKRRELESLIGQLHHVCKIAPQGRTFSPPDD